MPAARSLPRSLPPPLLSHTQRFLVFGRSGWIGGLVGDLLESRGATWAYASARLEDRAAILADFEKVRGYGERERVGGRGRLYTEGEGGRGWRESSDPVRLPPPAHPLSFSLPQFKPTHVLNAAGLTGRPNVDWCESHKVREKAKKEGGRGDRRRV